MKLGSLFDGIGGFPLSAIQHGIEPVWASEIEPFPIVVTKNHFPNMKHLGDITQINGAEIEPVEIITGGSPCQDLSVAGKRAGLAGERSGLFMEQVRIVKEMREHDRATGRSTESIRPRFMVWENVPGAFSSNGGEDFRAVLEETARIADETVTIPRPRNNEWNTAGAIMGRNFSIAWRVLDAQYWGVPQRRRRIFLVADFAGHSAGEILFKQESLPRHLAESEKAGEEVAPNAERSVDETSDCLTPWDVQSRRIHKASGKWPALYGGEGGGHGYAAIPETKVYGICSYASNSMKSDNPHSGIYETETSRTIDLNGGSPAYNQGGMATVQCIEPGALSRGQGERVWDKCPTLRANMGDNQPCVVLNDQGGMATVQKLYESHPNDSRVTGPVDIAPTISQRYGTGGNNTPLVQNIDCTPNVYREGSFGDYVEGEFGTLKASGGVLAGGSETFVSQSYTVRRLTPTECERLQGHPDGWTEIPGTTEVSKEEIEFWRDVWLTWDKTQAEDSEKVEPRTDNRLLRWLKNPTSDSAQYKALGNSVAVPCTTWIMGQIAKKLKEEKR